MSSPDAIRASFTTQIPSRAAFVTTTEIPALNNKQSRRKRKHGKSRTQRHHYPICKSGVCSDSYNNINNNFSQLKIDDGDLTVKANQYVSGKQRTNNANSYQNTVFATNSHTGYGYNGQHQQSFSNSFFNQNGNNLYDSKLMHQNSNKFIAANYMNNMWQHHGNHNMLSLPQLNGKYKNKYNIDYDNRLEEEFEIIHKIE